MSAGRVRCAVAAALVGSLAMWLSTSRARAEDGQDTTVQARSVIQDVVVADETIAQAQQRPLRPARHLYSRRLGDAVTGYSGDNALTHTMPPEWNLGNPPGDGDLPGPRGGNGPLIGDDFTSFDGPPFGGAFPPDPAIAVGPNHVVVGINSQIACYTKGGSQVWSMGVDQFFQSVNSGSGMFDFTSDPKVFYDNDAGKFFFVILGLVTSGGNGVSQSRYLIAVSLGQDVANSNAAWRKFSSDSTVGSNWSDYPGWGMDRNTIYITANYFSATTGQPTGVNLRIYPKAQFFAFNPPTQLAFTETTNLTQSDGNAAFTVQPCVSYDSTDEEYLVSSPVGAGNKIYAYQINGLASPRNIRKYALTVPNCTPPVIVRKNSDQYDSRDTRILNAVRVGDSIWCANHVITQAGGNGVVCRWYQFKIDSATQISTAQSGDIIRQGGYAWMPGICANPQGDAVVVHTEISNLDFASMYYSYRLGGDPPNTMRGPIRVVAGNSDYNQFRWGDYSTPALDPQDNSTVWGFHMYAKNGVWGTTVVRVPLTTGSGGGGGPAPAPCPSFLQLSTPAGQENWVTKSSQRITWAYQGNDPNDQVDLFLLKGSTFLGAIAKNIKVGDQGYNWRVGDPLDNNAPIVGGTDYRVLIRPSFCTSPISNSANYFTITESVVAKAAPPGATIKPPDTLPSVDVGPGESVTLGGATSDGQIVAATKGMPPYTYRWSPSDFLSDTSLARPTCKVLRTITYTLEVRDATGTVASDQVIVKLGNPLRVDAGPSKGFRIGGTILLEGSAIGGQPPYSYQWSPIPDPTLPVGLNGENQPQPLARPAQSTIFTLRTTDTTGAVATDTVSVVPGVTLTIINNPGNGGTVVRDIVKDLYMPGDRVKVEAVANAGFAFDHWEKPGAEFDSRPSDANQKFADSPTTITLQHGDGRIEAVYRSATSAGGTFPVPGTGTTGGTNVGGTGGNLLPGVGCAPGLTTMLAPMLLGLGLMRWSTRGRRR